MRNIRQRAVVLAGLSSLGEDQKFSPVQVQKLFFLIDREIGGLIGGQNFNFEPYDYGPFDKEVYEVLEELRDEGKVGVVCQGRHCQYFLTADGYSEGKDILDSYADIASEFISETAKWIKSLSFEKLVASIYKKYPDMKVNSIFRQ